VRGDRIAAAKGDNRRHIRNLAREYYWKTYGYDHIDLGRLHSADDLRQLADLASCAPSL
jgi:hypothetical protein